MSHPLINNRKTLLCSDVYLKKPTHTHDSGNKLFSDSDSETKANLLKYFPKYIHKLYVETKTGPVYSKVKRVKTLHIFESPHICKANLRRALLKTKEKQIQGFQYPWTGLPYSKNLVKETRAFTGLKTLRLLYHTTQTPYFLKKIIQNIEGLRKLDHLELAFDSSAYIEAISRLDSDERTLESLKTLKIDSEWGKKDSEGWINFVLKALLCYKNILKSTTNLSFGCFNSQISLELLEEILFCSPKLVSLSLDIDKPKPEKYTSIDYVPRYFQALGSLNNLQAIKIVCKDVPTHLRDFALPPSIQHVDLSLIPFDPSKLKDKNSKSGDLPEIATTFCDRWSHLINLKTLKIQIGQYSDNRGVFTSQFIHYWLKRVRNVQKLTIDLSTDVPSQSPSGTISFKGDLDLSAFLESIQHLKDTLEWLTLLDTRQIYYLKNLPQQPFEFPHLHKLAIKGFMPSQGFDIKRLFQNNLRDLLIKGSNEKPFYLVLYGVNFDSLNSFMSLMKSFDHNKSSQQRKLSIWIVAHLNNNPFKEQIERYFTLSVDGFKLEVKVSSSKEFDAATEPVGLLEKNLNVLKISPKSSLEYFSPILLNSFTCGDS